MKRNGYAPRAKKWTTDNGWQEVGRRRLSLSVPLGHKTPAITRPSFRTPIANVLTCPFRSLNSSYRQRTMQPAMDMETHLIRALIRHNAVSLSFVLSHSPPLGGRYIIPASTNNRAPTALINIDIYPLCSTHTPTARCIPACSHNDLDMKPGQAVPF